MLGCGPRPTPPFAFKCFKTVAQPSSPNSRARARGIPPPWRELKRRLIRHLVLLLMCSSGALLL
eukprot:872161-Prymnesium_polylepis.1